MTNETKQKDKNEFLGYTQEEILAVVDSLYGVKKIQAYIAAGKPDLAYNTANEELRTARVSERYSLPEAMPPYTADNWPVLSEKKKFDKQGIPYNSNVAKEKLKNTELWTRLDPPHPTLAELKTIDALLENNGLNEGERKNFLANAREKAKKGVCGDEISYFFYSEKETAYSLLAAYTGIPRKEVSLHYLDSLFLGVIKNEMHIINELSQNITKFIKRENIPASALVSRLEKAIQTCDASTCDASSSRENEKDRASKVYWLAMHLNGISGVEFPKKTAVDIFKKYVNSGNIVSEWNGYWSTPDAFKKDKEVLALREKAMRREMESSFSLRMIKYAIREFNLDPKEGWLGTTLKKQLNKWKKSDDDDGGNLANAISIGRQYALLSKEEIENLERKYKLIKLLKSD